MADAASGLSGLRSVERALGIVEWLLAIAGGAVLVVFSFLVLADVLARYLFNYSIPGVYELMQLALVVMVYFAISYAQQKGDHIRIEIFSDERRPRMQTFVRVVGDLAGLAICAIITWRSGLYAYSAWENADAVSGLVAWRTWPAMAAVPLGFGLLGLRLAIDLCGWMAKAR